MLQVLLGTDRLRLSLPHLTSPPSSFFHPILSSMTVAAHRTLMVLRGWIRGRPRIGKGRSCRWGLFVLHPGPHAQLGSLRSASWLARLGSATDAWTGPSSSASSSSSSTAPPVASRLPPGTRVYTQSKVLPFPQACLFDIVADVDRYHEFLPFCAMSRVVGPANVQVQKGGGGEDVASSQNRSHDTEHALPRAEAYSSLSPSSLAEKQPSAATPEAPATTSVFAPHPARPPTPVSPMRGPAARLSPTTPSAFLMPPLRIAAVFKSLFDQAMTPPEPTVISPAPSAPTDAGTSASLVPTTSAAKPAGNDLSPSVRLSPSTQSTRVLLADLGIGYGAFQEEYRSKVELVGQEMVRVRGPSSLFSLCLSAVDVTDVDFLLPV